MTRETNDAHIVAEILSSELGPDADFATQLEYLLLHIEIPEGLPVLVAFCRKAVEVAGARKLCGFERVLRGSPADNDGQVIWGTRCGADHSEFLVQETTQPVRVEKRPGLLEQKALVGRAASFGDEH